MGRTTTKQEEILSFVHEFIGEHGYSPTFREICQAVGLKSTATVNYHMVQLREKGLLRAEAGKRRTVATAVMTKPGQIPVIGVVTAGVPILAVENQEGTINWDGDPSCFALRVRGDSMQGAGILEGDLVVVRPQRSAEDGQIVVAMIEDEATVKTLRKKRGRIWLQPENPDYPIIETQSLELVGLVKAVVRHY